jgi:hypothetical protein
MLRHAIDLVVATIDVGDFDERCRALPAGKPRLVRWRVTSYSCVLVFIQTESQWRKLSENVRKRVAGGAARAYERAGSEKTS